MHPPESARAIQMVAIGNEQDIAAVARPDRIDLVVERAVVIARQIAAMLAREPREVAERAAVEIRGEHVKMPVVERRDEHDPPAVGREARFDVHRAVAGERPGGAALQVKAPQLHRVRPIGAVDHPASVGRPIRLVVIGPGRELPGGCAVEALAPQRAGHGIDQLLGIRRPGEAARTTGQLRQVHLAEIVGVRQIDLPEHRQALCQRRAARQAGGEQQHAPGPQAPRGVGWHERSSSLIMAHLSGSPPRWPPTTPEGSSCPTFFWSLAPRTVRSG